MEIKGRNSGTDSESSEFVNTDESFDLSVTKRKNSFVWQYFRQIEDSKSFECVICNGCVGRQTSNLSRHLVFTHNIRKQTNSSGSCEKRGRPSNSFIWKYCTKQDDKHALCELCKKPLYFGGGNTENIAKHLRRKHPDIMEQEIKSKENMNASIEAEGVAAAINDSELPSNGNSGTYSKRDSVSRNACYIRERKERKGGSYVWNYCDKISRHLIRCNLCNKTMNFHGTANVITHLQRKHNIVGKIDGDRATLENTVPDLNVDEELQYRKAEEEGNVRSYRRNSSTGSIVWKYCTRVGRDVVRCGFCKKNLSYQGTSNLQRHLHRMHGVVTQMRNSKDDDHEETEPWKHFNNNFIWQHCSVVKDCQDKTKCNLCNAVFDSKDLEEIGKHLRISHGIESKSTSGRRKRKRSETDDDTSSYDDDDFDNDWSRNDFSNDANTNFGESNTKKDESLFDEIIEEDPDHATYEEEPFDPSIINEMPLTNPLSPHSSRAASPVSEKTNVFKSKKLQRLNEEKVRMETEYFREKAGFYRMQKYLTALQASKMRKELEQMNNPANGNVIIKSDSFAITNHLPPVVDNISNAH